MRLRMKLSAMVCAAMLCTVMVCGAIVMSGCGLFMPRADRAIKTARETAAASRLRTILTAEVQQFSMNEKYGTLGELTAANLLPPEFASGRIDGYLFTVTVKPKGFEASATPVESGDMRSFSADESLEVRESKPAR
jgi:hypothetical protein